MQFLFGAIVIFVLAILGFDHVQETTRQAERDQAQIVILAAMERQQHPAVSQLVDDWRRAYPEPTEAQLGNLRILAERVEAAPDTAAKYTTAAKQKEIDSRPYEAVIGFGSEAAKPGL